ncbi:MAG TPA: TetR/AcrR family transcriptional regulator [Acidimicrobiales bacterium]|nr:TetR/AcrR family transcriptional regulator [Acidimicrobiales bacterium]
MAPPRRHPEAAPAGAAVDDGRRDDGDGVSDPVVRRAPFSDNPRVGARGQRTQQRIVDAALRVFGEEGYHRCGVARITELAGCSRASFYQYFSGKEDVFRHLAGQVARQLSASTEALGLVTPDADGWRSIRSWVARYADVYERYEPVFLVFQTAAESDAAVAGGSARTGERHVAAFRSRLAATTLPPRQLDPVIALLLGCLPRTFDVAGILRSATPAAFPSERIEDALADVVHRTLFGLQAVNVHPPAGRRPPALEFSPALRDAVQHDGAVRRLTPAGRRTLQALMDAGRELFTTRGYHDTRINDIVAAAGLSKGAFYRYFDSKERLVQILAVQAIRTVSTALTEMPATVPDGPARTAVIRRWLRRYNATQAGQAAMIRVWADATFQDAGLRSDSAAALDWGRRRLARALRPRGFGDVDAEAVVTVALLGTFGAQERPAATIDAAAHIFERGFLGH